MVDPGNSVSGIVAPPGMRQNHGHSRIFPTQAVYRRLIARIGQRPQFDQMDDDRQPGLMSRCRHRFRQVFLNIGVHCLFRPAEQMITLYRRRLGPGHRRQDLPRSRRRRDYQSVALRPLLSNKLVAGIYILAFQYVRYCQGASKLPLTQQPAHVRQVPGPVGYFRAVHHQIRVFGTVIASQSQMNVAVKNPLRQE